MDLKIILVGLCFCFPTSYLDEPQWSSIVLYSLCTIWWDFTSAINKNNVKKNQFLENNKQSHQIAYPTNNEKRRILTELGRWMALHQFESTSKSLASLMNKNPSEIWLQRPFCLRFSTVPGNLSLHFHFKIFSLFALSFWYECKIKWKNSEEFSHFKWWKIFRDWNDENIPQIGACVEILVTCYFWTDGIEIKIKVKYDD